MFLARNPNAEVPVEKIIGRFPVLGNEKDGRVRNLKSGQADPTRCEEFQHRSDAQRVANKKRRKNNHPSQQTMSPILLLTMPTVRFHESNLIHRASDFKFSDPPR